MLYVLATVACYVLCSHVVSQEVLSLKKTNENDDGSASSKEGG